MKKIAEYNDQAAEFMPREFATGWLGNAIESKTLYSTPLAFEYFPGTHSAAPEYGYMWMDEGTYAETIDWMLQEDLTWNDLHAEDFESDNGVYLVSTEDGGTLLGEACYANGSIFDL